jgi:hypothetical protein
MGEAMRAVRVVRVRGQGLLDLRPGHRKLPILGRVHRSIMWAKLTCLAEGAAIASKLLWH